LVRRGATFVVPIDAEPHLESSALPLVFDWTVLEAAWEARTERPDGAAEPLIVAVSHTKGLRQVPDARQALWSQVRQATDVTVVSLGEMNSGALRREEQARHAQSLLTLGRSDGVQHLGELMHAAGHPVIPLNLSLGRPDTGSELLARLAPSRPTDFFRSRDVSEAALMDSVDLSGRVEPTDASSSISALLSHLGAPRAFAVRLVNPDHEDFNAVERFFAEIVTPVAHKAGYDLVTGGRGSPEQAFLNQEIFELLHHADVVLADLTGSRPNCYLELGYALGRQLPTLVLAEHGTNAAFDTHALPTHFWSRTQDSSQSQSALRAHWDQQVHRPPIVQGRSLL
jgi:nucleoside 2-deoxyribosyltransferase